MSREEILAAIPHRPPMLLVDEIVERGENRIVCRKTFRPDEFFFAGHYPGKPIVPGVILCEAAMQAGAVLLAEFFPRDGSKVPVATRLKDVKFKQVVRPGQTVLLEVSLTERVAHAYFLSAQVMLDGKVAARLDFGCALAAVE